MVHEDNHLYLFEKQIFSQNFFETTKKLVELLIEKVPEVLQSGTADSLYSMMDRIIFDLIAMSQDNKQILDLMKVYMNMLS